MGQKSADPGETSRNGLIVVPGHGSIPGSACSTEESNQLSASSPPDLHALKPLVLTALARYVQCGHNGFQQASVMAENQLAMSSASNGCSGRRHILAIQRRNESQTVVEGRSSAWVAVGQLDGVAFRTCAAIAIMSHCMCSSVALSVFCACLPVSPTSLSRRSALKGPQLDAMAIRGKINHHNSLKLELSLRRGKIIMLLSS